MTNEMKKRIELAKTDIIIVSAWLAAAKAAEKEMVSQIVKHNNLINETTGEKIENINDIHFMDDNSFETFNKMAKMLDLEQASRKITRYKKSLTDRENALIDLVYDELKDQIGKNINDVNLDKIKRTRSIRERTIELAMKWNMEE